MLAHAGIQKNPEKRWIPVYTGMTVRAVLRKRVMLRWVLIRQRIWSSATSPCE
jgi:hypothetical protein